MHLSSKKSTFHIFLLTYLSLYRYYAWLVLLISLGIPMFLSTYVFGDTFSAAYHMNLLRLVFAWHVTWSINSVSHIWGSRPFEK